MYFLFIFLRSSKTWKAVLFICAIQVTSAAQCFSSANIVCDCDSIKIECSGVQINISEVQDILENFTLASNVIMKITNLHFESSFKFGSNTSVTNLTLGYNLQSLPSDFFFELGSSLISLNLQNNSIKLIDDMFFSSLIHLTDLFLDMNKLNELESSMFVKLHSLKYLSIASNDFYEVAPDTFQNLISLQTLILSHNNLSMLQNVNIKSSSLSVLKVDYCVIQGALENDTFLELPNLEELDLAYNKLSEVKPNSLLALKNLKHLNLSHNVIEFLQENSFMELNNLTHLDLNANKISIIKTTSFTNLLSLEYLDLSGNRLKAFLCEYTTDFAHLKRINLQDNEIKTFTSGAFYYSPLLQKLDITGNDLECSCELTDMSLYLIDNSTMKKNDLDSVFCIIPSTLAYMPITDYKSSKCHPQEPCKKYNYNLLDDYDYAEESENTTTDDITSTTPITSTTTILISASTSAEKTTSSPIISTETTTDSPVTSIETTTNSPITSTAFATILIASSTLDNDTASPTNLFITSSLTSALSTDTSTDSPKTSTSTSSVFNNSSFTDPETTTILLSAAKNTSDSITTTTETIRFTDSTTISKLNDNLTTINFITGNDSETSRVTEITTAVFPIINSGILNETTTTTILLNSSISFDTTEQPPATSKHLPTVVTLTPEQSCSSLKLSIASLTSDPEIAVIRNFSYDGNIFCLKWTIDRVLPPEIRCAIKYTDARGTKSKIVKCPSFPGDVKVWYKNEKIFKFCVDIHVDPKKRLCINTSGTTTPNNFDQTTTYLTSSKSTYFSNNGTTESSRISYFDTSRATTLLPNSYNESALTSMPTDASSAIPSSFPSVGTTEESTIFKTDAASTEFTLLSYPTSFSVTSFDIFFNASSFAYVKWTVSSEDPLNLCNLNLTVTTQLHDHQEGIFPCKKHTHQLKNVNEGELFKICLVSHHGSSGYGTICRYSLGNANFDAVASKSKDHSSSTHNSALIPLICLVILLVLIVIFIIFNKMYRKKLESDRYDVRAEEEKSQRFEIRPASSHDRSSVRYSYIAKENPDL